MNQDLSWYFNRDVKLETDTRYSAAWLCDGNNTISGRKVTTDELMDIGAFWCGDRADLGKVMYYHFYGVSGKEHRRISDDLFHRDRKDPDERYEVGITRWRMDLTFYLPGDIGNCEMVRSKGHVNKDSVELFQVLSGSVRVYIEGMSNGKREPYFVDLRKNDICFIPAGWYHSTHVLEGPAAVVDIVNREGFVDWKHKGYKDRQAAYTFLTKNGKFVSHRNTKVLSKGLPISVQPLNLDTIRGRFNGSLYELFRSSTDIELEQFATEIFSTSLTNNKNPPRK